MLPAGNWAAVVGLDERRTTIRLLSLGWKIAFSSYRDNLRADTEMDLQLDGHDAEGVIMEYLQQQGGQARLGRVYAEVTISAPSSYDAVSRAVERLIERKLIALDGISVRLLDSDN